MFWYRLCKIWVIFVGVNVRYELQDIIINNAVSPHDQNRRRTSLRALLESPGRDRRRRDSDFYGGEDSGGTSPLILKQPS